MPKKTKDTAPIPAPNLPANHPDALAGMADAMPWKTTVKDFPLETYIDAITKLRTRGYSYAEIANWLTEKLAENLGPKRIRRGQVYRVYQNWLQIQEDESWGIPAGTGVRSITDEEAEVEAELSDKTAPKPDEKDKP